MVVMVVFVVLLRKVVMLWRWLWWKPRKTDYRYMPTTEYLPIHYVTSCFSLFLMLCYTFDIITCIMILVVPRRTPEEDVLALKC